MEVDKPLFDKLQGIFKDFEGIDSHKNINETTNYDISVFVSRKYTILKTGLKVIEDKNMGDCLVTEILAENNKFALCTVHGLPHPGDKLDFDGRLTQSKRILDSVKNYACPKIIGGDFNLMPSTKSVKMFEAAEYRNLINDFNIENTRNNLSWEQFKHQPNFKKQYFADYVFVSPEVKVKSFKVPYMEISDHLPLILDFDI
jgi:endonuclease/exonuclease/phosphatase (EEP) superfamily protein YafD